MRPLFRARAAGDTAARKTKQILLTGLRHPGSWLNASITVRTMKARAFDAILSHYRAENLPMSRARMILSFVGRVVGRRVRARGLPGPAGRVPSRGAIAKSCKQALAALLLVGSIAAVSGQLKEVCPIMDPQWTQSLDGKWKFKYFASSSAGTDSGFYRPSYDASSWSETPVPSHWELQGFAPPKYKHVDKGIGLYRTTFRVPKGWGGRRIFVRFEGVLYGFDLWVNGKAIGSWSSSYNPSTFEVTDSVKMGKDNVLAVQVTTHCKGYDFDQNDCWALSGIYRGVSLFSTPRIFLKDYEARTTLEANGTAAVRISATADGASKGAACEVTGRLSSRSGEVIGTFRFPLSSVGGASGAAIELRRPREKDLLSPALSSRGGEGETPERAAERRTANSMAGEASIGVDHPQLWTAETPNLYQLDLSLRKGGPVIAGGARDNRPATDHHRGRHFEA